MLTFGTSIFLQGIGIITGIITARLLGPSGKGEITAITLWPIILAMICSMGIGGSIIYYSSISGSDQSKIFSYSLVIGILQSIFVIIVGFTAIPNILKSQSVETIYLTKLYLFFTPFYLITLYAQSLLNAQLKFLNYNLIRFTFVLSTLFGILFLVLIEKLNVTNVAIVYFVSNFITTAVALFLVRSNIIILFQYDKQFLYSLFNYGLKAHVSSLSNIVNERLDQLLISVFLAPTQLGYYAVAVTLTTPIIMIGSSIVIVALPTITKLPNLDKQVRKIYQFVRWTLWISLLIVLLYINLIPIIIKFFFGSSYIEAIHVTQILLIASIPLAVNRVFQAGYKAINQPLISGVGEIISAILTGIALLFLLPRMGIIAAGIVSLIAYSISALFLINYSTVNYNIPLRDLVLLKRDDIGFLWK